MAAPDPDALAAVLAVGTVGLVVGALAWPRAPDRIEVDAPVLVVAASVALDDAGTSASRIERIALDGTARIDVIEDPRSAVFHAVRCDPSRPGALLAAAGMAAGVVRFSPGPAGWDRDDLWRPTFGARSSRVRDLELAPARALGLDEDGLVPVVGTHDEGVVAILAPGREPIELGRTPSTLVHEIELGDLDGDGVLEVYATLSPPNTLIPGVVQPGRVVSWVPSRHEGPTVVVDLAPRHAKEILVADVDADGADELYVVVESPLEVRRLSAHEPAPGTLVLALPDRSARFLASGDLDGDGRRELVLATLSTGLVWLRPEASAWRVVPIEPASGGFEHAIAVADVDGDGRDEVYEADDPAGLVRRHRLGAQGFEHDVLARHTPRSRITWSLAICPDRARPPIE